MFSKSIFLPKAPLSLDFFQSITLSIYQAHLFASRIVFIIAICSPNSIVDFRNIDFYIGRICIVGVISSLYFIIISKRMMIHSYLLRPISSVLSVIVSHLCDLHIFVLNLGRDFKEVFLENFIFFYGIDLFEVYFIYGCLFGLKCQFLDLYFLLCFLLQLFKIG